MTVLRVALVGAGWISRQYAEALQRVPAGTLVAVASRSLASARKLADDFGVPQALAFDDLAGLFASADVDVVCVNSPNHLHAPHALAALRAGKHVVVEKPLCLSDAEAASLIDAARASGRGLGYAENLCFAPLYRRVRDLLRDGAIGHVLHGRQVEKHGGPYSPWFWRAYEAGGGALADMGCHGIECLRWLLDKPRFTRVSAQLSRLRHRERTALEDDAVVRLDLEDGGYVVSESSWAVPSGMQSRVELHGSEGSLEADLLGRSGLRLYREGHGWSEEPVDFLAESGYVGELEHFLACFAAGREPEEGGADGRAVLEILCAAYASAARGAPVDLPFDPGPITRPVELWAGASGA